MGDAAVPPTALLEALGLAPTPTDPPEAPEPPAQEPPAAPPAPTDDEIVVPEGAENPDAVVNAIKAERTKAREANARARALEAELQASREAALPLEQRITLADQRAAAAERRALAFEVAASAGLDVGLAVRLQGATREELEADAATLRGMLGTPAAPPVAPMDSGARKDPPTPPGDPQAAHNDFILGVLGRK